MSSSSILLLIGVCVRPACHPSPFVHVIFSLFSCCHSSRTYSVLSAYHDAYPTSYPTPVTFCFFLHLLRFLLLLSMSNQPLNTSANLPYIICQQISVHAHPTFFPRVTSASRVNNPSPSILTYIHVPTCGKLLGSRIRLVLPIR